MAKKKTIVSQLNKRIQTDGAIFISLGLISMIGFALNTYTVFTGKEITSSFSYPSILLGLGLIFESKIRKVLQTRKRNANAISKLITAVVGVIVLVGGLATIPILGINISGVLAGAIGLANLIAIVVILYEVFLVD